MGKKTKITCLSLSRFEYEDHHYYTIVSNISITNYHHHYYNIIAPSYHCHNHEQHIIINILDHYHYDHHHHYDHYHHYDHHYDHQYDNHHHYHTYDHHHHHHDHHHYGYYHYHHHLSVVGLSTNLVRIRRFIIIKPRDEHSRHHILIHVLRFPRHLNELLPTLHHGRLERIRIAHLVLRITDELSRVLLIRTILHVRWGRLLWMVVGRLSLSLSLRLKLGLVLIIVVVCWGNVKWLSQGSQISAVQHC